MRRRIGAWPSLTVLALVAVDAAPAQVDQARTFDVASVRLTVPTRTPPSRLVTNTRVDLTDVSLYVLLSRAFQIDQPSRLSAPDWLNGVRVDIHATLPEGSTRQHVPDMLKALLNTRFGLRTHVEPRLTDVYELVVNSGGITVQEVSVVDEIDKVFPPDPSAKPPVLDRTTESLGGRMRSIFTGRGLIIITERSMYERIRTERGTDEIDATRVTMADLAAMLSFTVDRPVVDRTGLTGSYRFRIELPSPNFRIPNLFGVPATTEPDVVSPFKAVEKLGLRLEPRRALLDTVVVDAINRVPTEN